MSLLRTSSSGDILTIYFAETKIVDPLVIQNIQEALLALLGKTEEPNVLLDFRAVKFLSSAALGVLLRAHKRCKEFKIDLILCNIDPNIREIFKITGLDKVLRIFADSEAAERAFTKKGRLFR